MKNVLHSMEAHESMDEMIEAMLLDILEGLKLRLAFEAWADARPSG